MLYLKTSSKPVAELSQFLKQSAAIFLLWIRGFKEINTSGFLGKKLWIDCVGLHEQISLLLWPCYGNFSATKLQFLVIVNLTPSWSSNCNIKEKKVFQAEKVAVCSSMVKKKKKPHSMKLFIWLAVMYLYKKEAWMRLKNMRKRKGKKPLKM